MDSLHFRKDFSPPGTSSRKISIPITDLLSLSLTPGFTRASIISLPWSLGDHNQSRLLTLSTKYWAPLATSSSSKFLITAGFSLQNCVGFSDDFHCYLGNLTIRPITYYDYILDLQIVPGKSIKLRQVPLTMSCVYAVWYYCAMFPCTAF